MQYIYLILAFLLRLGRVGANFFVVAFKSGEILAGLRELTLQDQLNYDRLRAKN